MVHKVTGRYESVIPPADLEGSMRMDPRSVTYSGRLRGETYNLPVSIRFADFTTTATVGITADFSQAVTDGIDSGFDAAKREVAAGLAELEAALTDLEFEVSLRGVRQLDGMPLEEAYPAQEAFGRPLRRTEDAREAQRAFVEHREPIFKRR